MQPSSCGIERLIHGFTGIPRGAMERGLVNQHDGWHTVSRDLETDLKMPGITAMAIGNSDDNPAVIE